MTGRRDGHQKSAWSERTDIPYCTQQQLTDRFGGGRLIALTDRTAILLGAIDTDVLNRALADTGAVINDYRAGRNALPLAATPALVADLARAIALWKLHAPEPEAKVKADYEAVMRTFQDRPRCRLIGRGGDRACRLG
jgi:phage gp36-like protein